MFISVVFNTEYFDIASRTRWYLKNLLHCKDNGWILITHEYMRNNWEQLQKEVTPSLFQSWEMRPFTPEELKDVEQYFIPDELFEQLEEQYGSRTEMLVQLSTNKNDLLENCLQQILDSIKVKHPKDTIQGMFHCMGAWRSTCDVCEENNIQIIPYFFSAIRKPHGYRQTLDYANLHEALHSTNECKQRYEKYKVEDEQLPVFSHRELIAIFGKERTLPLIPLMNAQPKFEMGICTECFSIIPQFFIHDKTTDDDLRYESEKLYEKSQISVRNHSLQVDFMQLDRSTTHNDPAAWILSCKRLAASRSQIMLKVLLWGRTAIQKADTMGFSFMCEKDFASTSKVNLQALNYYLFAYLIPNDLMFSDGYWQWRMTSPSETEIYQRHLDFLIRELHLPQSLLTEKDEPTRFKSILQSRGCDENLIDILVKDQHDFDIDYNTASSRIVVNGKSYWRLNKLEKGVRHFQLELNETTDAIEFYPLDDVAGCAKLVSVKVNGQLLDITQYEDFKFMPKIKGHYSLPILGKGNKLNIDIEWDYMPNEDFLNAHS